MCDVDVDAVERSPKPAEVGTFEKVSFEAYSPNRASLGDSCLCITLRRRYQVAWEPVLDQFTKTPTEFPILPSACAGGEAQRD